MPSAWLAYLAFIVTAIASAAYLWRRTRSLTWDRIAGASAEIGVLFMGIALVTGSLWGSVTWGTYWVWDARLTTTAFLFVTYIGYLAVRRLGGVELPGAGTEELFELGPDGGSPEWQARCEAFERGLALFERSDFPAAARELAALATAGAHNDLPTVRLLARALEAAANPTPLAGAIFPAPDGQFA